MTRAIRGLLVLGVLLAGAACGASAAFRGGGAPAEGPRARASRITFEEMRQRGQHGNLYDLISELRPRWLRSQGPDTFIGKPGQVQVHMDGNRLGGVDVLKQLAAAGVTSIEWVAPIEAGARFGLNNSHGAIIISTRPVH